jgi:hypothetical protein
MKKTMFFAVAIGSLLMTACGGEKNEKKKEEKVGVSDILLDEFALLSKKWDRNMSELDELSDMILLDDPTMKYNIDSIRTVFEKLDKESKTNGLAYLDSLEADEDLINEIYDTYMKLEEDWLKLQDAYDKLYDGINGKEISEEDAKKGLSDLNVVSEKTSDAAENINKSWAPILRHTEGIDSILNATK